MLISVSPWRVRERVKFLGLCDAVLCDAYLKFDRELLERADRLLAIATPRTGTNHLDKSYLRRRGIDRLDLAQEHDLLNTC